MAYIQSISINMLFFDLIYTYSYATYLSHLSLHGVNNINVFIHKLFGYSNNLVMAKDSKSQNDVKKL